MKNSRSFINVFLLSLILVFNLCVTPALGADQQNTYEQTATILASTKKAAAPTISKKSYTLVKGQTVTLKVNNTRSRVTWSSSNNKIAISLKDAKAKGYKPCSYCF